MPGELGTIVPQKDTLLIPQINKQEELFRTFSDGAFSREPWAQRNFSGSSKYIRNGNHLWRELIPASVYFNDHPEWFALVNGKRIKGDVSHVYLCTSNLEMQAEALKNLKAYYEGGYEIVRLYQADGYKRCRCAVCEAMDEYRENIGYYIPGTPCYRIWDFHDFLARGIKIAYPDAEIILGQYGPAGEVPIDMGSLSDNVIVEWCHPDPNTVENWRNFHNKFSAFRFWFTSEKRDHLPQSLYYTASEFSRMAYKGAKGFCLCHGGYLYGLNAPSYYLLCQYLRDPKLNEYINAPEQNMLSEYGENLRYSEEYVDAILDEFCQGLFQEAAEPMKAFFETFHTAAAYRYKGGLNSIKDRYVGCFTNDILDSCEQSLTQAYDLADNDNVHKRIQFFRDGFDYIKLTTYGFARLKDYEADSSYDNLRVLVEAVYTRNNFVKVMYNRQQNNPGLPLVIKGSCADLLYGKKGGSGCRENFAMPFKYYENYLRANWHFDNKGSADEAVDSSIFGNHGTLCGNAEWTDNGKIGKALEFDGTSGYVDCGGNNSLNTLTGTLEAWVKTTNDSGQTLYAMTEGATTNNFFAIFLGDGCTYWFKNELITICRKSGDTAAYTMGYLTTDRNELFDGNWHHLTFTWDGSSTKIYLDGDSKTVTVADYCSDTGEFCGFEDADTASIGAWKYDDVWGAYFNGAIDEVRVYNSALSGEEIYEYYLDGS